MSKCDICEKMVNSVTIVVEDGVRKNICDDCFEKRKANRIENALNFVSKSADFESWTKEDLSEAFWLHLAKYQKHPNQKSISIIYRAYLWAVHDDHGLSNSFRHALDWCKIDLFAEMERKDIPEDYVEEIEPRGENL